MTERTKTLKNGRCKYLKKGRCTLDKNKEYIPSDMQLKNCCEIITVICPLILSKNA